MTQIQKFAALLIVLGEDTSRLLLQVFEDHESEQVAAEIAKVPLIGQEQQTEVLREFTEWALQANAALGGSVEYTRVVLEKTFGLWKAAEIIERIASKLPSAVAMDQKPPTPTSAHTLQRLVDELQATKSKRFTHSGFAQAAPERITIEVLKQLTRENPAKMSQAARLWAYGTMGISNTKRDMVDVPLSPAQKVAALLILLGEDAAGAILKHADEGECGRIAAEMAVLPILNLDQQTAVLKEFTEMALANCEGPKAISDPPVAGCPDETAQSVAKAQAEPPGQELEDLLAAKTKLVLDFGLGQQAPERITIEVLKQLIHENPAKISQVARNWLNKAVSKS